VNVVGLVDYGSIESMTDIQLYIAVGLPVLFNAAIVGLLMAYLNAKIDGSSDQLNANIDGLRNEMNARFDSQTQGLLRVEDVLDARLKHLEERGK
jgi:hypothetical protein